MSTLIVGANGATGRLLVEELVLSDKAIHVSKCRVHERYLQLGEN